ncbi:hypothetical protein [Lentzea sp. E54]|uniref:hypothetical protein n=1 Tax=Lentzea xerophila TaxID=3435883 RepID=UPI003DA52CC5
MAPRDHRPDTDTRTRASRTGPPSRDTRREPQSPTRPATRRRGSTATARRSGPPTPATVWVCGHPPTDPAAIWPTPVVKKVVTSFTAPGARVVLLTTTAPPDAAGLACPVPVARPQTDDDRALATATDAVRTLGRDTHVIHIDPDAAAARHGSTPFWADLVGDPQPSPDHTTEPPPELCDRPETDTAATADLVIANLPPERLVDGLRDHVALLAARLLRTGCVLAVLTHSHRTGGRLVDPSGPIVAAAQAADLLYLQHIVAVHAPVRDGDFTLTANPVEIDRAEREQHHATVRDLPTPHRMAHSDVLVFAQPRDHEPLPLSIAAAVRENGIIR